MQEGAEAIDAQVATNRTTARLTAGKLVGVSRWVGVSVQVRSRAGRGAPHTATPQKVIAFTKDPHGQRSHAFG